MNIAQLTYSYQPIVGGGDVYAAMLADLFTDAGHEIRVYQHHADTSDRHVIFVPNPLARFGRGEFWTQTLFIPRLRRYLSADDIVIAHYPNYLLAAACARSNRRPLLIGLSHGVFWDDRPGSLRSRLKRMIARAAFRRADSYVANDTFFLREMGIDAPPRQSMFTRISPNRWFIPNCVPPLLPQMERQSDIVMPHAIIVPRNLYRNRGVHLAVEAFAVFASRFPDTHLYILGKNSQPAYAAEVKQRIASLGLAQRVIFAGHVPHERMPDYYASTEICLIPSLCGEGTSLSALEAMAYGVATISTDVAGLKDLPTVQCAPAAEALADAMSEVYPDRHTVGADQRNMVRTEYSHERWSKAWLDVIEDVARAHR